MEEKGMGRRDERREEGVSEIWEEMVWERRVERELGEKETSRWKECLMGRVWDCKELTFSPFYQFSLIRIIRKRMGGSRWSGRGGEERRRKQEKRKRGGVCR